MVWSCTCPNGRVDTPLNLFTPVSTHKKPRFPFRGTSEARWAHHLRAKEETPEVSYVPGDNDDGRMNAIE